MLDKNNEVFFGEYCKTCKYKNYSETDCPCSECIAEPVNLYSHKPIRWEGADGVFSGPPPRPDHAYQRAVKYVPERRKDKEKAIARQNIDAEYAGNKVQNIDCEVTDDQYPSATAVKKALDGKINAPQVAQVGEVLTVEEVDAEGKPKKWKTAKSGTFVCTFDEGENGWITCDKTVEEIITANNDRKDVIGHYYGDIYRLSTPLETGGGYGNPIFSNLGVGVLSIIQYDGGHFGINRIRLSDIAPEDIPISYEVPVYVPTRDGMQWQYGRPLLATDYVMNELTDEEKALMQKNLGIDALSLVKYTEQELTDEEQVQARKNIGAKPVDFPVTITSSTTDGVTTYTADKTFEEIKAAYESGANVCVNLYGNLLFLSEISEDYVEFGGIITDYCTAVKINSENIITASDYYLYALKYFNDIIIDDNGNLFVTKDYSYATMTVPYPNLDVKDGAVLKCMASGLEWVEDTSLPSPTTAQVGQVVKVKAVDADGKVTETEAVDMSTIPNDYELVFQETVAEDVGAYSRDTDKDGNPFSLTDVMVIIFTKPFAESTNSAGRGFGFLPTSRWGKDCVSCDIGSSISSANSNSVGRYNVVFAKVVNGYQVVTRAYESQNTTNVFGILVRQTKANNEMFRFHTDANKLMQLDTPQGNITCVKIVGYTNPLVSSGTIVALYKKKGT